VFLVSDLIGERDLWSMGDFADARTYPLLNAEQILAQGTGEFATQFGDNMNAVVFQVAQAERGFGTVQDLGVERWNDDGSADVIAVSMMTTKMPNGTTVESGNRWVVTATREGEQWKVSSLLQVI
jgi:Mce-associated membrane protein